MSDVICGRDVQPRPCPVQYSNLGSTTQLGGSVDFAEIFKREGEGTVPPTGTVDESRLAALSRGGDKRHKKQRDDQSFQALDLLKTAK
jgi:hypothetical protein